MHPARILVADDDRDICELVALTLRRAGHEVATTADGTTALDLVRTGRPQVAVLDVMMPGRSGLEIVEEVRADDSLRSTGILLLTAKARDDDAQAALAAGADDYVVKPFSPRRLVQRVDLLLQRRTALVRR